MRLNVPGADQPHVRTLRSLDDSRGIIAALVPGQRVVVVGASFIGMEVAATVRIANEIGAKPPRLHIPYRALYGASCVAERLARLVGTEPIVTRLGVKLFGTDNRHAIEKARRELGYSPAVSLREGIRLAADWYRSEHQSEPSPEPALIVRGEAQVG